jgi:hypothetical protein
MNLARTKNIDGVDSKFGHKPETTPDKSLNKPLDMMPHPPTPPLTSFGFCWY